MSIFKEIEKLKEIKPGDTIYVNRLEACVRVLNVYRNTNGISKVYHIRKCGDDHFVGEEECRKILNNNSIKAFRDLIKEHSMFNDRHPREDNDGYKFSVGDKVKARNNHLSNTGSHIIYRTYSKNDVYFYDLIDALGRRVIAIREDNIYKI